MTTTLDDIGIKHHADKSSVRHHYLALYELLFKPYRNRVITLLEVGIQFGCSIRLWREAFPRALILGLDAVNNATEIADLASDDRCRLYFMDAYSEDAVTGLMLNYHPDIMIDDGSHTPEDQKFFLTHYSQFLAPGGLLIIEDILCVDTATSLLKVLPADEWSCTAIDMVEGLHGLAPLADSRLFIACRKNCHRL